MAEEKKARGGIGTRAKKFMGSRTAGTKLGRKAILNVLGEDGEILFNAIKESAKLYFGETQGKKLKEDMLKMILKINLLVNEKTLTPENTSAGQEPIHALLFQAQLDFDGTEHHVDPSVLSKRLNEVSTVWIDIVKKHMQEKNIEKLQEVIIMLGDVKFLDGLFNGAQYKEHRDQISASLGRMMDMFGIQDPNAQGNCQSSNCLNKAVRSRGLFRSAGFCARCHADQFHSMCDKPTLQDFLLDERASSMLTQFLNEDGQIAPFQFLRSVSDFKAITSQKIRLRAVMAIKRKYLDADAALKVDISEKALAEVLEKIDNIDEESPRIPTSIFGNVENDVRESLTKIFDTRFVKSQYFERFVASYRLSKVDAAIAEKQRQGL